MRYMHIQVCGLPRLGSIVSHQEFNLKPQHSLQLAALLCWPLVQVSDFCRARNRVYGYKLIKRGGYYGKQSSRSPNS